MPSTDYLLPQLPLGNSEYTVVRWLKRAGDAVSAGEPLLVVVNDCVEAALPATGTGILETLAAEGAVVVAGMRVASIAGRSAGNIGAVADTTQSAVRISPAARNIARLQNIDITTLHGTGVSGRIMKADVFAALITPPPVAPALGGREGRAYAGASLPTPNSQPPSPIPGTYVLTVIDVDLELVATLIAQHGPTFARRRLELSYCVCVAAAAVAALPYHPLLNSYWADTLIVARRRVHLAIVPCDGTPPRFVRDAQDLNLRGLARALGDAAEHSGQDRTFTIANLGDQLWGAPVARAGNCAAALGLGAVRARPLVIDDGGADRLVVRHAALLTLAYDARVLDQSYADAFLRDVKRRLEQFHV